MSWVRLSSPSGTVMCQLERDGYMFTVRDRGLLKYLGRQLCSGMGAGTAADETVTALN